MRIANLFVYCVSVVLSLPLKSAYSTVPHTFAGGLRLIQVPVATTVDYRSAELDPIEGPQRSVLFFNYNVKLEEDASNTIMVQGQPLRAEKTRILTQARMVSVPGSLSLQTANPPNKDDSWQVQVIAEVAITVQKTQSFCCEHALQMTISTTVLEVIDQSESIDLRLATQTRLYQLVPSRRRFDLELFTAVKMVPAFYRLLGFGKSRSSDYDTVNEDPFDLSSATHFSAPWRQPGKSQSKKLGTSGRQYWHPQDQRRLKCTSRPFYTTYFYLALTSAIYTVIILLTGFVLHEVYQRFSGHLYGTSKDSVVCEVKSKKDQDLM